MIKIEAIGNLGKDAELKIIGGNSYASFSIATSEKVKGETKTTWFNVMKIDKEGKLTAYLTKGMKVWVSGRPSLSAYVSKNTGEVIPDLTIWANELDFCSPAEQKQQQAISKKSSINSFSLQEDDGLPF